MTRHSDADRIEARRSDARDRWMSREDERDWAREEGLDQLFGNRWNLSRNDQNLLSRSYVGYQWVVGGAPLGTKDLSNRILVEQTGAESVHRLSREGYDFAALDETRRDSG